MKIREKVLKGSCVGLLVLLLGACGENEDSKSDLELAQEYCTTVCRNLKTMCPENAEDMPSDQAECVHQCAHGDEPEGQVQDLGFLKCLANAQSCDDWIACKQES